MIKKTDNFITDIVEEAKPKKIKKEKCEWITSGSTVLDLVTGGGWPVGKIINLVGDNSSGKTLIAVEAIANAHKKFGKKLKWVYDDAEAGFSFDSRKMYSIDIIGDTKPSETIEEFETNLHHSLEDLKDDEYLIYVLDCLDALSSLAELEFAQERRNAIESDSKIKGTYGMQKQKFLSEFFRLQANRIKEKKCLLIIISQVRTRIALFPGPKYTRSGGKALDFYAAIIVWLAEVEKYKKMNRTTGVCIKVRTTKNKVALPFREAFVDILFDYGLDNVGSNLAYLADAKTDSGKSKKSVSLEFNGETGTVQKMIEYVEKNNLEKELSNAVIEKWKAIDEKISNKNRKVRW